MKKRSGRISYVEDPYGLRSHFFQSVGSHSDSKILDLLVYTFESKDLQVYARYLCGNNRDDNNHVEGLEYQESFLKCSQILRESLLKEKTDSVPLRLALLNAVESLKRTSFPMRIIWDLRLLRSMYETKCNEQDSFEVFSPHQVAEFCQRIDNILCCMQPFVASKSNNNEHDNNDVLMLQGSRSIWFCEQVYLK